MITNCSPQKKHMVSCLDFSIVDWFPYITFELFWKILEIFIKKSGFHFFFQIFYKKCNIAIVILWDLHRFSVRLTENLRRCLWNTMSHISETPSISNVKPSLSIKIPSTLIENLGFRSKYLVFRIKNFEILGFSHLEFEILGISSEIPSISKTWNFD